MFQGSFYGQNFITITNVSGARIVSLPSYHMLNSVVQWTGNRCQLRCRRQIAYNLFDDTRTDAMLSVFLLLFLLQQLTAAAAADDDDPL